MLLCNCVTDLRVFCCLCVLLLRCGFGCYLVGVRAAGLWVGGLIVSIPSLVIVLVLLLVFVVLLTVCCCFVCTVLFCGDVLRQFQFGVFVLAFVVLFCGLSVSLFGLLFLL